MYSKKGSLQIVDTTWIRLIITRGYFPRACIEIFFAYGWMLITLGNEKVGSC